MAEGTAASVIEFSERAPRQPEAKLRIFISYSRKDEDFAQELLVGLQIAGFEPYLDKRDIAGGEDWAARLGRLIEGADTMVLVNSPDAVASRRCAWEVDRAIELRKRLLPIVWRRVGDEQVPPRLRQLNYIYFDRPFGFAGSLQALSIALRTDIVWIREHTRIGEAAARWDARARAEALLLRGEELAAAKTWLTAQPEHAPEPTLLHHEFIKASEDAEVASANVERQRLAQMAVALEREKQAQGEREKALLREKEALRRGKRALAAAAGLFTVIVIGAIGLRFQNEIKRQWFWASYMRGHSLTPEQARLLRTGQSFRECARSPGVDGGAPGFAEYSVNCPEMVVVPTGKFIMGTPPERGENRERPQIEVTLAKPFAVSKFEITAEQWGICVAYGGCGQGGGEGKDPVSSVTWHEAKHYLAWLSSMTGSTYRLLSNSEWEYVARAGSTNDYWWGEELGKGNANCANCGSQWDGKSAAPVGSFKPNAFGLYDVHGNVWEWVEDPWHDD